VQAPSDVVAEPLERFANLSDEARAELFHRPPEPLRRPGAAAAEVGAALGAVLYGPATSPTFGPRLLARHWPEVTAAVLCLEDAIGDDRVAEGEERLGDVLGALAAELAEGRPRESLPFLFVRVRSPEHLEELLERWGPLADGLDGFVLPKVTVVSATRYLDLIRSEERERAARGAGRCWALPILEGPEIAQRERRLDTLLGLRELFADFRDLIPGARIGATDLSGHWGLRRTRDFTVYDVGVVRDAISDAVNVLGGPGGVPAISGPVWEYIREDPVFKPPLRETPFREELGAEGIELRRRLVSSAIDGLLRETMLDGVNGLHGKTVIHPSHVLAVDAAHTVSFEEYTDAEAIVHAGGGGVEGAGSTGRMNEPKPHTRWAQRTLARSRAFGVLHAHHSLLAILGEA